MRPETLVRDHTIYACVMGSRAFGLATRDSDTDRRGVFLAPTPLFWRFEKPPTHVEGPAREQFSWELERFCELGLRAYPNILERLHLPRSPRTTPATNCSPCATCSSPAGPTRRSPATRTASATSSTPTCGPTAPRAGSTRCTCCGS
ncbi:hypothetical protein SVIOM342S_10234 [Streptomyces violaceorubidus]